jgi:hypothetical protein
MTLRHRGPSGPVRGPFRATYAGKASLLHSGRGPSDPEPRTVRASVESTVIQYTHSD